MKPLVQVLDRSDGFVEVWVGCEHEDFARNQVRAMIRFHRIDGAWAITINDPLMQAMPEAIHACLGVAIREMSAHSDGSQRG